VTITPETVAALIARTGPHFDWPTAADLARSWQDQHAELDRLRTIVASLVEEPGIDESMLLAAYRLVEITEVDP